MENPNRMVSSRVTSLLDLPEGFELWQDWDLIWANADQVHHYLDVYINGNLDDQEKRVLMELMVSSYDNFLNENPPDLELEKDLRRLLVDDVELHAWVLGYWSAPHRPEGGWNVTPMIRQILEDGTDS